MRTSRKRLGDVTKNFPEKEGGKNIRNKLPVSVLPVIQVCYIHTYLKLVFKFTIRQSLNFA